MSAAKKKKIVSLRIKTYTVIMESLKEKCELHCRAQLGFN